MKVFISVGMRGRADANVEADIERAKRKIRERFGNDIETVDNWSCEGPEDAGRLWYLGEAVKKLGDCDACYFVTGWDTSKGCLVEYNICKLYGIEMLTE